MNARTYSIKEAQPVAKYESGALRVSLYRVASGETMNAGFCGSTKHETYVHGPAFFLVERTAWGVNYYEGADNDAACLDFLREHAAGGAR